MKKIFNWFLISILVFTIGYSFSKFPQKIFLGVQATSCKTLESECSVNSSHKECCSGLYCQPFNSQSENGKCQLEPTPIATNTPVPTQTPLATSTPTSAPSATPTNTPTNTPTYTPTPTEPFSPSPTPTNTPSISFSPTPTLTPTSQSQNTDGGSNNQNQDHGAPACNDSDPGVPANLRATALGGGQVRLDWDHAPNTHTGYAIAYGPSIGNYIYGDPNVGNVTTYTVKALTPGGKYCFYVQAQNGCRGGSPSNVVCSNQGIGGGLQVLGATDNFNPIVAGIRESYGGEVLGVSTQLADTAEIVYATDKLPSGNILDPNQTISIPKIGLSQAIYQPQKIGDQLVVGHNEVLKDGSLYYGHNGYGVFSQLYKVNIGDKVIVNNQTYQVDQTLFVHKSQVDAVKTDSNQIALMTCSVTEPDFRIIVKASLSK